MKIRELRLEMAHEFGLLSTLASYVVGPVLLWSIRREERRLAAGQTYETETVIERRNWTSEPTPCAPVLPVLQAQEE